MRTTSEQNEPLFFRLATLAFKAVYLECLDREGVKVGFGSGVIVSDFDGRFIYTCWHVVTGYELHPLKVGRSLPKPRSLRVHMQDSWVEQNPRRQMIGGLRQFEVPLYRSADDKALPLWLQDEAFTENGDLDAINLRAPKFHDVVKIPLPPEVRPSHVQLSNSRDMTDLRLRGPFVGDRVRLVGFPYGYSALGPERPTPVVLSRHVAAERIKKRPREILIDGPGADGMSGGPVFLERDGVIALAGLYTGIIYPEQRERVHKEKATALGAFCDLSACWTPGAGLKPYPGTLATYRSRLAKLRERRRGSSVGKTTGRKS